jgi:hypothetical protein
MLRIYCAYSACFAKCLRCLSYADTPLRSSQGTSNARRTSHVTRHTSHVTRHTSCRTSTIPHRTQHARCTFAPQRQGGGHCRTCKCVRVCVCVVCVHVQRSSLMTHCHKSSGYSGGGRGGWGESCTAQSSRSKGEGRGSWVRRCGQKKRFFNICWRVIPAHT